jgi:S-adenosylmethionine hydrolase
VGERLSPVVTLLTDFGTADGYVGEVKGVLLSHAPVSTVVDISHDVAPQDVEGARLALARYWRRFPVGTVHIVVVDPGVGSARAAIAVESDGRFLVGPDNGALSPALFAMDARAVVLAVPPNAAPTFHGRDVFAPAAARLVQGATLDELGEPLHEPVRRRTPEPRRRADGAVEGEVLTVDRFGNAVTNLYVRGAGWLEVGGTMLPVVRTYAEVPVGTRVGVIGSSGLLEVAVREGNAARELHLARGATVTWHPSRLAG